MKNYEADEFDLFAELGIIGMKLDPIDLKDIQQLMNQLTSLKESLIRKHLLPDQPVSRSIQILKKIGARVSFLDENEVKFEQFASIYLTANTAEWFEKFAQELVSSLEKHEVFRQLPLFLAVAGDKRLKISFFVSLLSRTLELSSDDLMQGEIWKIFHKKVTSSDIAFEVIDELQIVDEDREKKESNLIISACLKVARIEEDKILKKEFAERLRAFEKSNNPERREVFYNSFVGCNLKEIEELQGYIQSDQIYKSLIEEVIIRALLGDSIPCKDKKKHLELLIENVGETGFSSSSKYYLLSLVKEFLEEDSEYSTMVIRASLPIPADHIGTWNLLATLLGTIKDNDDQLARLLEIVSRASPESLSDFLDNRGSNIVSLSSVKKCSAVDISILRLAIDADSTVQKTGLKLLEVVTEQSLPIKEIQTMSPQSLQLLFYGTQLTRLNPKTSGRILSALADEQFAFLNEKGDELFEEVLYQFSNTSKFRDSFEKHSRNDAFLEKVKKEYDSTVNRQDSFYKRRQKLLFESAHYLDTRQLSGRKFAKEMGESMEKHSSLLNLFTQVFLPYGGNASMVSSDGTQSEIEMRNIEHSQELPWLELVSPEKEIYRRSNASSQIRKIKNHN